MDRYPSATLAAPPNPTPSPLDRLHMGILYVSVQIIINWLQLGGNSMGFFLCFIFLCTLSWLLSCVLALLLAPLLGYTLPCALGRLLAGFCAAVIMNGGFST